MNLKEITIEALKELGKGIKGIKIFEFIDISVYDITFVKFKFVTNSIYGTFIYSLDAEGVHSITAFQQK